MKRRGQLKTGGGWSDSPPVAFLLSFRRSTSVFYGIMLYYAAKHAAKLRGVSCSPAVALSCSPALMLCRRIAWRVPSFLPSFLPSVEASPILPLSCFPADLIGRSPGLNNTCYFIGHVLSPWDKFRPLK